MLDWVNCSNCNEIFQWELHGFVCDHCYHINNSRYEQWFCESCEEKYYQHIKECQNKNVCN